jgi:hypothetical protein
MNTRSRMSAPSLVAIAGLCAITSVASAQLTVQSISPTRNALNVARNTNISITFDRAVDPATFTPQNFHVFGRWSAGKPGPVSFSPDNRTVTLNPNNDFFAGEAVTVYMSRNLRAADGTFLRAAGYSWQFTTVAGQSPMVYRNVQTMTDRSPNNAQTRIYGGLACDLDLDSWPDLTIINEVSADVRVFMNRDDGSSTFNPNFLTPVPIAFESSANAPGDFNLDGLPDIATASSAESRVSVLLGLGNGSFQATQYANVGTTPHGIAILDADGDADMDIATANTGSGNVALLINNGSGVFAPAQFFNGGGNGEYGLASADMNNDGILDIISANQSSQTICVLTGNGNGTFTQQPCQSAGGATWMIRAADYNGDGNMDIGSANSFSGNAAILLGNGNGTFQPAIVFATAPGCIAIDHADLDGDGDLDIVTAHFQGSQWRIYKNNGSGMMSFYQSFPAQANGACVVLADWDNDLDIDIAMLDEIADVVIIQRSVCPADFNGEGGVTVQDIFDFLAQWNVSNPATDFNGIGGVTVQDIFDFLAAWNNASDGTCD